MATVQLSHRNAALVSALGELSKDGQERAAAEQGGVQLPADWYRRKALALIGLNDRLQTGTAWTVFMPGSWSIVDDLDERVRERFEQEFGGIAVTALEREMLAHVGQLTGVARDPGTGQLIVGDDCAAPQTLGADTPVAASLAPEDQPAMRALQRYVGSVDQLDAALQAMERLQQPSPDNADALRLAVRYAFGTELQGNVAASLPYFYRNARRGGAYATDGTGGISLPTVRQALRCSFDKGAQQLDDALFTSNPLVAAEQSVSSHLNTLSVADAGAADFTKVTGNYRAIATGIGTEQDLLAAGKGAWMRQTQFAPGSVYERTFARAAQNRLLGPELVGRTRERSASGFQAFRSQMAVSFGGPDSGIVWADKGARYEVSPERIALREGLGKLLNQPFMVAPRGLTLPAVPDGSIVAWDRAQLDQALALGDVRKRFLGDGLASLPEAVQPAVEQALDVQFARLISDQVAAAAAVTPAQGEGDSGAFDAARLRLVKIRAALADMGASDAARRAGHAGVARRARSSAPRRRRVERVRSCIRRGPRRLAVSGARTARCWPRSASTTRARSARYLDQQATRAIALGRQASVYLAALGPGDAGSPLAMRWQAIVRDLDRYQLKNPNSSLFALEQFVQTVAADPGAGDCLGRFPARPSGLAAGDYFSTLHARLYDALLARCGQGYVADLRQQWAGFASAFNQGVGGHPPFGVPGRGIEGRREHRRLRRSRPGAAPLRARLACVPAGAQRRGRDGCGRQYADPPVRRQLRPGRRACSRRLYPATDGAPAGLDVSVDFRANRSNEIAANQVIDWTLKVGDQSVSLHDAQHPLHWEYGMPVSLSLRFAKDSPLQAAVDPQQRAYSTDGRTLTWQFSDPWALMSFIGRQRMADAGARGGNTSQLLKFEFPLGVVNVADEALLPKQSRGQVFVRLVLSPAGKKTALPWPASFPTRAPDWTSL